MKRVVSVSLGSSSRNHVAETEILGEKIVVERRGTDGDMDRAIALVKELDGKVDAFGMGGIDLYFHAGRHKKYVIKEAVRILEAAKITPMVDGGGIKDTWEYKVVGILEREYGLPFKGRTATVVQAVSRYGMALGLAEAGAKLTFGDLAFTLGLPIAIHSFGVLNLVANIAAPFVTRMSFESLYPTGSKQQEITPKYPWLYASDYVCGDFLYIRQHLPEDLSGRTLLTNTVTSKDVELLKARKAKMLVTISPELQGRSFGANVLEAILIALAGKRPEELSEQDYFTMLDRMQVRPRVEALQ